MLINLSLLYDYPSLSNEVIRLKLSFYYNINSEQNENQIWK